MQKCLNPRVPSPDMRGLFFGLKKTKSAMPLLKKERKERNVFIKKVRPFLNKNFRKKPASASHFINVGKRKAG